MGREGPLSNHGNVKTKPVVLYFEQEELGSLNPQLPVITLSFEQEELVSIEQEELVSIEPP